MVSPKRIPLNIIDRVFLVPESSNKHGSYFPMCIILVVRLNHHVDSDQVRAALVRLDDRFPQYRLNYRLIIERPHWELIPNSERAAHFDRMVETYDIDFSETFIERSLATNNEPITEPLRVMLCGDTICIKLFHVFGDGRFLMELSARLLLALFRTDAFQELPDLPDHYFLPLGRLLLRNPSQVRSVSSHILNRIGEKIRHYLQHTRPLSGPRQTTSVTVANNKLKKAPIKSGSAMKVIFLTIPSVKLQQINDLRITLSANRTISLNTFLQVYLADRIRKLGLVEWPTTVTILTDLHRYFDDPTHYYPGNYISNIQASVDGEDFVSAAESLQEQMDRLLRTGYPLADIPASWLLSLGGDQMFRQANREWLLKSSYTDDRFFVLTNLGQLDHTFSPVSDYIAPDIQLAVPLMGAPPLTVAFNTFQGQGNIAATYDPRILSSELVRSILRFELPDS